MTNHCQKFPILIHSRLKEDQMLFIGPISYQQNKLRFSPVTMDKYKDKDCMFIGSMSREFTAGYDFKSHCEV